MTIKDLITFLESSAKNCKDGVDTPIRSVRLRDGYGEHYTSTDRSSFILEKMVSPITDAEYVNLLIEEEP